MKINWLKHHSNLMRLKITLRASANCMFMHVFWPIRFLHFFLICHRWKLCAGNSYGIVIMASICGSTELRIMITQGHLLNWPMRVLRFGSILMKLLPNYYETLRNLIRFEYFFYNFWQRLKMTNKKYPGYPQYMIITLPKCGTKSMNKCFTTLGYKGQTLTYPQIL